MFGFKDEMRQENTLYDMANSHFGLVELHVHALQNIARSVFLGFLQRDS